MAGVTLAEDATRRPPILDDPFLWLEEVEGKRALEWVKQRNGETLAELQADKRYEPFLAQAEALLNATDRIPYGSIRGRHIYNFWRDAGHVRGILRRTTLESYRTAEPEWETVLDVDALARAEDENWVYKSIAWLAPGYERCLVKLSRGGTDASVHREFDALAKRFVEGGFVLPEAKSGVAWLDRDTLLVATNWGAGSLTESGYPRIAKRWKRGTPLAKAETVFEGRREDIGIWPRVLDSGEATLPMIDQSLTFYTGAYHLIGGGGKLQRLPLPESVDLAGFYAGRILFTLRDAWEVAGQDFPGGSAAGDRRGGVSGERRAAEHRGRLHTGRPDEHRGRHRFAQRPLRVAAAKREGQHPALRRGGQVRRVACRAAAAAAQRHGVPLGGEPPLRHGVRQLRGPHHAGPVERVRRRGECADPAQGTARAFSGRRVAGQPAHGSERGRRDGAVLRDSSQGTEARRLDADDPLRLRRVRDFAQAKLLGDHRQTLARARRRVRRGEHPGRRRVRAALAQGRAQDESPACL